MTERVLLAAGFVLLIAIAGQAIRTMAGNWSKRVATATSLAPAEATRLLVFSSRWCSDCAIQKDVVARSQPTWGHPVEVSLHDAVTESELARSFGIIMVPALVVARADGQVVDVRQGLVDEDRLRSLIEAAA